MAGLFQFDTPFLTAFWVLISMGFVSLTLSLLSFRKLQALKRLPKRLVPRIFDRTFEVFNPFPEKRTIIHSYAFFLVLSPLVAFSVTFALTFLVVLKILEMGLIIAVPLTIVCLGLLMIGEIYETHTNASAFLKAIENGDDMAVGDLVVLSLVREVLPKLITYYVLLGSTFFVCAFTAPFIVPAFIWAYAGLFVVLSTLTAETAIVAPFAAAFIFSLVTVGIYLAASMIRTKVFGFLPSGLLTSAWSASARAKITSEKQSQILESKPEETTW